MTQPAETLNSDEAGDMSDTSAPLMDFIMVPKEHRNQYVVKLKNNEDCII